MASLGELYFALGLDSEQFDKAIEAAKKKVADLGADISVNLNVDASKVAEQVRKDLGKVAGNKAEISLEVDKKGKASIEELVEDIRQAKVELERLKTSEAWNTSAIDRQGGFIESLERQLEVAKATKKTSIEASKAIREAKKEPAAPVKPIPVKAELEQESYNAVKTQLAKLGEPITTKISVEYDLEKFQAAETAMKNFGQRIGRAISSGSAAAPTPTPQSTTKRGGVMGWIDKVTDTLMDEGGEGSGVDSERKITDMSSALEGLSKQLESLGKATENISKRTSGRKQSVVSNEEDEMKRYYAQLQRLEEGVRRWENVKAKIESSKVDKDSSNYQKAIRLIDDYIDKLVKAQEYAGKFSSREMASMLGQTASGAIAKTGRLISQQKSDEQAVRSNLAKEQAQIQRLEEGVRRVQNVIAKLNASGVDKTGDEFREAMGILDRYINKLETAKKSAGNYTKREMTGLLGQNLSGEIAEAERLVAAQKRAEQAKKKSSKSAAQAEREEIQLKKSKLQLEKESVKLSEAKAKKKKAELQKEREHVKLKKERVSLQKKLAGGTGGGSNWTSQLGNQFNNLISVYSIERFMRNLYTIGGEFQKQQIALQNMIGDAEKGNVIFERMKDLSVKSPYTFSELSSYTKQMAAYGVEYDELYDTTKRLADISAGVGVDMGRLILAYGQVRSAEVLRGQELRQFTEAGIPLVSELAKRLSEVRGEAVKVGEVFDAISKRQVSFDMVKDVLFDMTDPGGRFYSMQEELAKSLAGQWSNLKDAWDIMIADIANSTNNVLGGMSKIAADLLRNWREWIPVLSAVVTAIGTLNAIARAATVIQTTWNAVTSANPWAVAAKIIIGAASAIGGWIAASKVAEKNTEQLNMELDKEIQMWNENRTNALRYIDTLKSANTSEERRILLYSKLIEMYPDLLKNMKLEQIMLMDTAQLKTLINEETVEQQLAAKNKELRTVLDKYEELRRKRRVGTSEFVTAYREPTDEEKVQEAALLERIQEIQKEKQELQKAIDRAGKIEELKPDSALSKYVEVYGNLGKAVKILRQGGIKGGIANPKEFTTTLEYYDSLNSLLKEQEEIKKKFKPNTAEYKDANKLSKIYKDAINAIGGVWNQGGRGKTEAELAAEREAKAYYEALKAELAKIGGQWDLYKTIFEATGNKRMSLSLAFDGEIPSFKNYLEHLKGKLKAEIDRSKLGVSVDDLLLKGKEGVADLGNDKSKPQWTDDVAKNVNAIIDAYNNAENKLRKEQVDKFVDIIKSSKDFAQQIADIERELQDKLKALREQGIKHGLGEEELKRRENELIQNAEEEKTKVRFEEFKKSSDWVKVFDDLDRVSDATLDNMITKIEEFARQGKISEEVTKQLVEAMGKLRDEAIERNPFKGFVDAWKRVSYWRNYDVNSPNNIRYNDKTGKFEKQVTQEQRDNNLAEANADLEDSSLGVAKRLQGVADAANMLDGLFQGLGMSASGLSDILGGIASGAQQGAGIASALGYAGPWGAIAGAAVGMLSAVFAEHDKALQREIEASEAREKAIKNMADLLETQFNRNLGGVFTMKLSEDAKKKLDEITTRWRFADFFNMPEYSADTKETAQKAKEADSYYLAQLASLKAQRDEIQHQREAELDKKDTDNSKVEDYENEIKRMEDEISNFAESMMETLYGIDFSDWANQFATSIVDAWAAGEDAAIAYKNTVGDVMRNVATTMIQQAIIGKYLEENLQPILDKFEANDGVLDEEIFGMMGAVVAGLEKKVEDATEFADAWETKLNEHGFSMKDSDSSGKGGLSKGIKNITEETADLLASYLNAVRASVDVNRGLFERLMEESVPRISFIAEAQLRELSQIQANTARNVVLVGEIKDLMNRVIDKSSNRLKI